MDESKNINIIEKNNVFYQIINELLIKYENNPYIIQRLETHLLNLPNTLEQEENKYTERINRFNELTIEQDNFNKVFLNKHQYFYMPYNNIYYKYDGKTYKVIKDDEIYYNLLSTITCEGKLIQWKHKTKLNIIKQIKERSLFKSTPETYTIQNVLSFLQSIFKNKTESKYFLTVIGDCILKKNNDKLLFFVSSNFKKIIHNIDDLTYKTTGNSIISNFITKYHHNHKINLYRLIKTNDSMHSLSDDFINNIFNKIGIDLLCVATHYSERYGSSDMFLTNNDIDNISSYVKYFTKPDILNIIINDFMNECIEFVSLENGNNNISLKNMHYIWKLYLSNKSLPNIMYVNSFSDMLQSKMKFKLELQQNQSDTYNLLFINVTSKYLPSVSSFLSFWEKHITILNDDDECDYDYEYEIDELMTLYKMKDNKRPPFSDVEMIQLITHYFSPQVKIINDKYVTNIKCNLWLKNDDINNFLSYYKFNAIDSKIINTMDLIDFDNLYKSYKHYILFNSKLEKKIELIVSKQYFERYLTDKLTNYIKFETFVSSTWLVE